MKSASCGSCRIEAGPKNRNRRGGRSRHRAGYIMVRVRGAKPARTGTARICQSWAVRSGHRLFSTPSNPPAEVSDLQSASVGPHAGRWRERVEHHFGCLPDNGFSEVQTDDSSFWVMWVQYLSYKAGVRISHSTEFQRAEVNLIRLVHGKVPPHPIWIASERVDWVLSRQRPRSETARLGQEGSGAAGSRRHLARSATGIPGHVTSGGSARLLGRGPCSHRRGRPPTGASPRTPPGGHRLAARRQPDPSGS